MARRDGRDQILVQSTLVGGISAGEAAGTPFSATSGSVTLVDLRSEIVQESVDTHAIHMLLSRDLFTAKQAEQLTERGVRAAGGALLTSYMASLLERLPGRSAAEVARAERSAATVLLACSTGDRDAVEEARAALSSAAVLRAHRFIETHLARSDLDPGAIASAAGVSRATLYRLFASTGGVARFVQQRRLEAARTSLLNPLDTRSLTAVALGCGFVDGAHFSRLFREVYGFRPSDLRPLK